MDIHNSCPWMSFTISWRIEFCWVPHDLPASNVPTMPSLSEHTIMWQFVRFPKISDQTASSTATILPQPISCPSDLDPSLNCHASHFPSEIRPIPHPVDASMNSFVVKGFGGWMIFNPTNLSCKHCIHHAMSSEVPTDNLCFTLPKWLSLNLPQNLYSETNHDCPSGMMRQAWFRVPITLSASFIV